jgi:hypothetical protein
MHFPTFSVFFKQYTRNENPLKTKKRFTPVSQHEWKDNQASHEQSSSNTATPLRKSRLLYRNGSHVTQILQTTNLRTDAELKKRVRKLAASGVS